MYGTITRQRNNQITRDNGKTIVRRAGCDVIERAAVVVTGGGGGNGDSMITTITASVDVSALLPIKRDGSRCSSSLADAGTFFAVSANGASAGGSVRGVTGGYLRDASWSWTPGAIYRSPTGTLTQNIPASGVIHEVAHAVSATEIIVDPQSEIIII